MGAADVVRLPGRWRRSADPERGVLVTARCPVAGASGVVPLIRLEMHPVPGSLHTWREDDLRATAARRRDFELDDEDDYDLGGWGVAYRRFGYRRDRDDVLCEQWAWLVDGIGYTLTCTVGRADYPDYCDVFEAVAETFEPLQRATA
jgi:hypothetical protein